MHRESEQSKQVSKKNDALFKKDNVESDKLTFLRVLLELIREKKHIYLHICHVLTKSSFITLHAPGLATTTRADKKASSQPSFSLNYSIFFFFFFFFIFFLHALL